MSRLTDSEKLMYDVMGAITNGNVPVIYKGAMVTKLILMEHGFTDFTRETQDIDASWAEDSPPSMERLTSMLNDALSGLDLTAVVKREYGEKMSAGYKILDVAGGVKFSIDIDMRAVVDSRTYQFGNVTFQGVTPDNVIADKISVIASDRVFRRSKDLIDVYALSHCVTVKTDNIRGIWKRESRAIGTFDSIINRQNELRYSYEKLRRINAKPEFDKIYGYLLKFLRPFAEKDTAPKAWNSSNLAWDDVGKEKKPSILGRIQEYNEEIARTERGHSAPKRNDFDR
jgi:hypothetical protein